MLMKKTSPELRNLFFNLFGIRSRTKLREMSCVKTAVMEAYMVLIQTLYLNHYGWPGSQDFWQRKLKQNHGDLSQLIFFKNMGVSIFFCIVITTPNFWKNPKFHCSIDGFWLISSTLGPCINGQDLILFNNRDILINRKFFFLPKWKEKGVVFIHDVLDNCGKILSFNTFQTKFNLKSNCLNYLQVVLAIPKHLLQKSRSLSKRNRFLKTIQPFNFHLC